MNPDDIKPGAFCLTHYPSLPPPPPPPPVRCKRVLLNKKGADDLFLTLFASRNNFHEK